MKVLNFTIIKLLVFFIIGIIICHYSNMSPTQSIVVSCVLTCALLIILIASKNKFNQSIWFGCVAYVTAISIGVLTTNLHNQIHFKNHYSKIILNENDQVLVAFKIKEILKPGKYHNKYVAQIIKINKQEAQGKVLLNIVKDSTKNNIDVDNIYITKTDLKTINTPLNPSEFNYKDYLMIQYIYHQIYLSKQELFEASTKTTTIYGWANQLRNHINKKLQKFKFNPDVTAIVNALILGQRQDISAAVYSDYNNAGAIHILAVSGLHVGIILLILNYLLKPLEYLTNGRFVKPFLLICFLWCFAIITGLSASVTRAVTMFSILTIALHLKRPTNTYNTIALSAFVLLLFKPLFLFDVGFQLSYVAVLGILIIDPILYKLWQTKYGVLDKLWHTLTITISAQLGILPISLFYFHQFPGLFFITNLVIIPFLGFILGFGILIIILASLNLLPAFVAQLFETIINVMNAFISWISQQTVFIIKDIPFNIWFLIASYLFITSAFRICLRRSGTNIMLVLVSIVSFQIAIIFTKLEQPNYQFIVFHKNRQTLLANIKNNTLFVASDLDSIKISENKTIKNFATDHFIKNISVDPLKKIHLLKKTKLLLVDSLGIYNVKSFKPDYILLRQSPKINLNRLIDSINPKVIIADGSNYKSYLDYWETVCKKRKLPFHQTGKMGAYIINY
ncbi:competence protein [Siansivirga zeaxanthinifaciens CC-SAMT-1]|uniref:Competence protein n=2 Tax=Siansivirga TaxID=1204360 RepID=A0A0C5W598_9FLAO|nr:competence protein [Siansivirga zeaxanthinifaciens CC-SAMT-1]